ncbi:3-methyl-2-oxobutanoate dehydrogenase subunit VorB [Thermospira aquatica]|uniref:3-methyl-2-oxobutanoate dehydrogenase subunit VorB n=1 Tax=Thermospira aquatica TaxID=2828656 RepID=A0AAX3BAG5_9SPIR|nr:3-methyl-2-oxobutanoate dehydrogenase subunit VorB [Thermospira aquatica]URA09214.1 3-methyl-2-oxobutanoate dehydrogenase subunit VorB [Thermospira aquatica]
MNKVLMKGNEAMAEGAIRAGCRYYFGYPITPQNEVPAYFAKRMPEVGGVFVQAESETASINMVYGAAAAGARVMTTTSSPGYSLMQEGVSYLAGSRLPCVLANVQRGGPGLGNIAASQADYFQATKGGGHGDYHLIVLAPASAQEMMDFTMLAFELSDTYRVPALILSDGIVGQMVEPVELRDFVEKIPEKPWALTGARGRKPNVIRSLWLDDEGVPLNNEWLQTTYETIRQKEVRWETFMAEDAEYLVVAYGSTSRTAKSAILLARQEGIKVGLIRPITLWPFPYQILSSLSLQVKGILVCEMSAGQMVEDVALAVDNTPLYFAGELGGRMFTDIKIQDKIHQMVNGGLQQWQPR